MKPLNKIRFASIPSVILTPESKTITEVDEREQWELGFS
jgi:hypothetical protein